MASYTYQKTMTTYKITLAGDSFLKNVAGPPAPTSGTGDMTKAVYDPTTVEGDAFDMANMVEATDAKVLTAAERSAITANTAKVTNATHTGDVTGSEALTITAGAVTNAKLADVATSTFKGRTTAGTGSPEDLTATQARTILNVEDGAEVNNISDANATDLTDGGDSTLHYHATDRARANHTGTQADSTVTDPAVTTLTIATGQTSFTASASARRFYGDLGSGTALEFTAISGLTNGGEPVLVVVKTTGAGISFTWPSTPVTSGTAPAAAGEHGLLISKLSDGTLAVDYLAERS